MKTLGILCVWGLGYLLVSVVTVLIPYPNDVASLAAFGCVVLVFPLLVGAFTALSGRWVFGKSGSDFWRCRAAGWAVLFGYVVGLVALAVLSLNIVLVIVVIALLPISMIAAHGGGYLAFRCMDSKRSAD